MCELANVKTVPELKLQSAFSGANDLQLNRIVGTERKKTNPAKVLIDLGNSIHIFEKPSNRPKVFGTFAACMHRKNSKLALTEIQELSN